MPEEGENHGAEVRCVAGVQGLLLHCQDSSQLESALVTPQLGARLQPGGEQGLAARAPWENHHLFTVYDTIFFRAVHFSLFFAQTIQMCGKMPTET